MEKGNPCAPLVGMLLVQWLWKTVLRFLKVLKIELSYDPAIPLPSIYLKEMKTLTWKEAPRSLQHYLQ